MAKKRRNEQSTITPKNGEPPPRAARKWLTDQEVSELVKAARLVSEYPDRDAALILIAYRHGFRVSELIDLRWEDIDFHGKTLFARRLKGSESTVHSLEPDEIQLLKRLRQDDDRFVFWSYRAGPLSRRTVHHIVARAGREAGLPFAVHPHHLRHACGHVRAELGEPTRDTMDWLGHKDIRHTELYSRQAADRFKRLKDTTWSKRAK